MRFVDIDFRPGFTVYKNGRGPVWVCPHSGPAMETPTSRDGYSDVVASLCWLNMGGTLIISSIPRKQIYGIDFNRESPPKDSALNLWSEFLKDEKRERLERYRHTYSWTSINPGDHRQRSRIYDDFWNAVKKAGEPVVFVHRQFTRVKNFPSVMDVVTFEGRGVNKKIMEAIVEKANEKYSSFLKHIERDYKDAIKLEHRRVIDRIKEVFSEFILEKMKVEYKKNILNDMKNMSKYVNKRVYRKLEKEFNERNYMSVLRSTLRQKVSPKITVESFFKGDKALRSKNPMFMKDRIVMEVEVTNFLGYWHPGKAAEMIMNIFHDLISVDTYSELGVKQKHLIEYVKNEEIA